MANIKRFDVPVIFGSTVSLPAPSDPSHAARRQDVEAAAGSTSVTGILKGNGSVVSAAVAGTDYLTPAAIGVTAQAYDATLVVLSGKAVNGSGNIPLKSYVDAGDAAAQAYADALVVGLVDDRGNFNASGDVFPSTGGSGSAGAIKKGDLWTISVAGTLGGAAVAVGDQVRALTDAPGQTAGNWAISEANIGYVPLSQALASGKIYVGNGSGIGTAVTVSGDWTISNSGVATLENTAVAAGSYGSESEVAAFTVDAKGRLTEAAGIPIAIPLTQISDMSEWARDFNALVGPSLMRAHIDAQGCVERGFEAGLGDATLNGINDLGATFYIPAYNDITEPRSVTLGEMDEWPSGARIIIGDFQGRIKDGGSLTVLAAGDISLPIPTTLRAGEWVELEANNGANWRVLSRWVPSSLWSVKTAGFSMTAYGKYQTVLAAAASAALPTYPVVGDWFEISDAGFGLGAGWNVYNLTIPYVSAKINGGTASFVCNIAAGGVRGVYVDATIGWAIKAF